MPSYIEEQLEWAKEQAKKKPIQRLGTVRYKRYKKIQRAVK